MSFLRKTVTTMGLAAITSAALLASVAPAGAASLHQAHFSATAQTQIQQPARAVAAQNDFRVAGVRIWSAPRSSSNINGLGYQGQGFLTDNTVVGDFYACDNGTSTNLWDHGRNNATGVTGWVPICNLIF